MAEHSLSLGGLVLTGDASFADDEHGFWFEVCAEGTDFGSAEATTAIVQSLLSDGDLVQYRRDGNRTIPIRVRVRGSDLGSVAHGEAALRRELKRRNELTWQPPDDFAPVSVYESFPSPMSRASDGDWDLDEKLRKTRTFSVSLTCSPYARSLEPVVVEATPPPLSVSTVVIDTADTTTNLSAVGALGGGFPSAITPVDGGAFVSFSLTGSRPAIVMSWNMSSPVAMSSTRYLLVQLGASGKPQFTIRTGGTSPTTGTLAPVEPIASRALTGGRVLYVLDTGGATLTQLQVRVAVDFGPSSSPERTVTIEAHDLSRSNAVPEVTGRQVTRSIAVGGTERTPGSIHVTSPSNADLNQTIVATWPESLSGFSPSMRRWRGTGNPVFATTGNMSGQREALGPTAVTFYIPATSIPPGNYMLLARLRSIGGGLKNIYWDAQTIVEGVVLAGSDVDDVPVSLPTPLKWEIVSLGILALPVVAATAGDLYFGINHAAGSDVEYDEMWLIPVGPDCAVSVVDVGASHLWLDSPDIDSPVPRQWIGNTTTRSNARHPGSGVIAEGSHIMSPGSTTIFTASSGADSPQADVELYHRWPHSAAD